jgi:pimeloyl-ACP methyl ester carboxylesterase
MDTSLLADMRATPAFGAEHFASIEAPILAIYGENSELRARGETCLARARRCRFVVLPGSTHSVLWEQTDRVRALILEFVTTLEGRSR